MWKPGPYSTKRRLSHALQLGLLLAALQLPGPALADDGLLKLLRDKGVISQQEFAALQGEKDRAGALTELLARKGVISQEEAAQVRERPASVVAAAETAPRFKPPFGFEDPVSGFKVEVNGRLHADYRSFDTPVDGADNTFEVRRARLGATVNFGDYYEVEVTGDFSEEGAKLDTGYANFAWWQPAQLRIGKFKMPFSLEELTSSNYIDFQERSLVNALVPGKLTGLMLHGSPARGIYYGLALSNGAEDLEKDNNDSKDLIGRIAVNAAEIVGRKDSVLHFGLGASNGEALPAGERVPSATTEGRGLKFFKAKTFSGDDNEFDRLGGELALAYGPIKLQGEYVRASYEGRSALGVSFDREISAYYASLNWLITGEAYADAYKRGAFSRIKPKAKFSPGGGLGAFELGLRYSSFDAADFSLANPLGTGVLDAGYTNGAKAWTSVLKWIPNDYSRFMLNWVRTDFDSPVTSGGTTTDSEDALTLRAQVNF